MRERAKIENLGIVTLNDVSVADASIDVHISIENIDNQLDETLEKCFDDFYEKHPYVKGSNISYDTRVVFSFGGFRNGAKDEREFSLTIIIWSEEDVNAEEFYFDIPVELNEEGTRNLRRIVWNALGKMLFDI